MFLHHHRDFPQLIQILARENNIPALLVEKDYWIMHCLYSLRAQGFSFELKGGTSLSKGYHILQRFSEDIDIHIDSSAAPFPVYCKPTQTKKSLHNESRRRFYDWLTTELKIGDLLEARRDPEFDDEKFRSGGIRLFYKSHFPRVSGVKAGVLLEVGFDDTTPNQPKNISSWALDRAQSLGITVTDNRALDVPCYHPGFTFVEKLQTISTKYRIEQKTGVMPKNFMRHYYDICQLLDHPDVISFVSTPEYHQRKKKRFRKDDHLVIAENEAFVLSDPSTRQKYTKAYQATESLYFGKQPDFEHILEKISRSIDYL